MPSAIPPIRCRCWRSCWRSASWWPMGALMRGIDYVRDSYGAVVARLVRIAIIGMAMVVASVVGIMGLGKITPTGFLPEDDQGAFFVIVQLPDGASVGRSTEFVR